MQWCASEGRLGTSQGQEDFELIGTSSSNTYLAQILGFWVTCGVNMM